MEEVADTIARHALASLLALAALTLVVTLLAWRLIERYGPRVARAAGAAWQLVRSSTVAASLRTVPGLGRFLSGTLTMGRYLGVYALLAFAACLLLAGLFFELADDIGFDEDLARFDALLAQSLGVHASHELLRAFAWITHLGDRNVLIAIAAAVAIFLFCKGQRVLAAAWLVATSCGALLNVALKALFERTRPAHDHGVVFADGWSFPSGHASGAMLIYGLLAYLIIRLAPPRWHLPVTVGCVALVVFVGFSRVLLQVHYLSDVVAGYASAGAWTLLSIAGLESARWRRSNATPASG